MGKRGGGIKQEEGRTAYNIIFSESNGMEEVKKSAMILEFYSINSKQKIPNDIFNSSEPGVAGTTNSIASNLSDVFI